MELVAVWVKPAAVATKVKSLDPVVVFVQVSKAVSSRCKCVCLSLVSTQRKARVTAEVTLTEMGSVEVDVVDLKDAERRWHHQRLHPARKSDLSGSIDKAVNLKGIRVTKGARAAIEAAGGKIEE